MSLLKSCQAFRKLANFPVLSAARPIHVSMQTFSDEYKRSQQTRIEAIAVNHAQFKRTVDEYKKSVVDNTKRWVEKNEIYYGSERDLENFPTLKQSEYHPKVRIGFIPDAWFQAFYDKTGVTGPYLFFGGATLFAISKEYWVVDHEFFEVPAFMIVVWLLYRKLGPVLYKKINERRTKWFDGIYTRKIEQSRKEAIARVAVLDEAAVQIDSTPAYYDAARENVDLQLEVDYRERLVNVRDTVAQTLQYHADRDRAMRNYRQKHMVDWLVNSVVGSVTPQLEKDTFRQCISDLQRLAAEHKKSGSQISVV